MALIFANKSALKASVISWLADGSIADETIDRAIALVEADLRRRLRLFQQEVSTELPLTKETITVPSRYLAARVMAIPGRRPMEYLTPEGLLNHQVDNPGTGEPTAFTLEGREDQLPIFRFSRAPNASYTVRLLYIADPALQSDEDTNAILEDAPDCYHYGVLTHLGGFVRNKERLPEWGKAYDSIVESLIDADLRDKVDGSALRPRSVYRGV